MSSANKTQKRFNPLLFALGAFLTVLLCASTCICAPTANAAGITYGSSGGSATIAPSTSIKYKASSMSEALWNHGCFYVYFFQGTKSFSTSSKKASGSDIATSQFKVEYSDGVAWAKVHVAAVSSSSAKNGGAYKRLKDDSKVNQRYSSYLAKSKKFYVWISDTGGSGGTILLEGARSRTVYADGKTFANVKAVTVQSQPGSDHYTQGATESDYKDIINIPFCWTGKDAHQVPSKAFRDKGAGSSGYTCHYRLNWQQYADGTTYEGCSIYKLKHGQTKAVDLWSSVNLGAIGITATPTYKDEALTKKSSIVFRNYNATLGMCLKKPSEQIKLDTDGGVLTRGTNTYSGSSVNYKKCFCETEQPLPRVGYKIGKDGSKGGYELTGYLWKSGTNRAKFSSTTSSSKQPFTSFDQAKPEKPTVDDPVVTVCNSWQTPAFSSNETNASSTCKSPTVANVTYKALWKALEFKIHYVVNGSETKTVTVDYDEEYTLDACPAGASSWTVLKDDGSSAPSKGYMPAQDIYAYAQTAAPNTVRYYLDGQLIATYSVPFGSAPLTTTYYSPFYDGIEFNNDGVWDVDGAFFKATYKDHYNIPDQVQCSHWVDTSEVVDGKLVTSGYYRHSYDLEANYSYFNVRDYTLSFAKPGNAHGGQWHGWYTDSACTQQAGSTVAMPQGSSLSFYSYTTHSVSYVVNGSPVLTQTLHYGATVRPYEHGEELNTYGGDFRCWYTDQACTSKAPSSAKAGNGDLVFYAYTSHEIHFWMDTGTKVVASDAETEPSDEGEEPDDGTVDKSQDELSYCLIEKTVKYGEVIELPAGPSASATLTRKGCEDWATCNGKWFKDSAYTQEASSEICRGDATYYSYNVVKVSYDLSTEAKKIDAAEGGEHQLFQDKQASTSVTLRSFLPQESYQRYGVILDVEGDGQAYWVTSGGITRMVRSVKGGFLDSGAGGERLTQVTLLESLTIFKDWAQGLYDGVVIK